MSQASAKSVFLKAAVSVAAAAGLAGPAHAAVYAGSWDPGYGSIFPSLGWSAKALFDVPDACLALPDGTKTITGACAGFAVLSAQVDFYNFALDPNPLTSPVLESFSLNPGVTVSGITITGGQLAGVGTNFFNAFVPSGASASIAGNGAYAFSLILLGGKQAQLVYAQPIGSSPGCGFVPVDGTHCGISKQAAVGVFAPVPEPETYALLLAGLGVVGFAARRRRA